MQDSSENFNKNKDSDKEKESNKEKDLNKEKSKERIKETIKERIAEKSIVKEPSVELIYLDDYGHFLLRISVSLVFLWFGINQLYDPLAWTGFVPQLFTQFILAKSIVIANGCIEIVLGLLLISGTYTRIVSILLGIHLLGIADSLGYSAIAVRDFGLALATLSIAFFTPDIFTIDARSKKQSEK